MKICPNWSCGEIYRSNIEFCYLCKSEGKAVRLVEAIEGPSGKWRAKEKEWWE